MRRSLTVYWCTCACPTSYLKESRSLVRKIISPPFSFDVQILLHHLGDPQVAERLARGFHRGGRGVFPGLSARPITSITRYTLMASSWSGARTETSGAIAPRSGRSSVCSCYTQVRPGS